MSGSLTRDRINAEANRVADAWSGCLGEILRLRQQEHVRRLLELRRPTTALEAIAHRARKAG